MLGPKQEAQGALFYEFSIEDHVPLDHVLRAIDGVIDLVRCSQTSVWVLQQYWPPFC